mgnify:CR=1 FL=1
MYKIVFNYYRIRTNKFVGYRPLYLKKIKPYKKVIHKRLFTIHEAFEVLKREYSKVFVSLDFVNAVEVTLEKGDKVIDISNKVIFDYL